MPANKNQLERIYSITINLRNVSEYEAAQMVLDVCGNAKVRKPEELKMFLRRIANKILYFLED